MPEQPRVVVLVRPGCHLCETVLATVGEICGQTGDDWSVVDIDAASADPALRARYTDYVPVVLVDGAEFDYWRVSGPRLQRALTGG